jgi:MFS family permease
VDRQKTEFFFLNLGHFFDHLFMLVFATVAALSLAREWGLSYAELIPYATPGFIAFGLFALPAGWLADKWSRQGMMVIFFIGIGLSSMLTSLSQTPWQLGIGLFLVGAFAAIYHPVGLALVVHGREKTGHALAVNGVFGNMGVACAALITGFLIDTVGWKSGFVIPGLFSIAAGIAYWYLLVRENVNVESTAAAAEKQKARGVARPPEMTRQVLKRIFFVIFFSTAVGGLVFQSTTFALPKVLEERLVDITQSATVIGWYAFLVFALAAFAQLVVGYLVDRYSVRIVFACVAGLQVTFFAIMTQVSGMAAVIVAVAFMLAAFGQIPINDVLIGRVTKSEWRSRVFAARYVVTFSVMASSVPLIAWLHAGWGFDLLFQVLAVAACLIFAAVLTLPAAQVITGKTLNETA